jgi:hypothetical protein
LKAKQNLKGQLNERQSHRHLGSPGILLTEHNEKFAYSNLAPRSLCNAEPIESWEQGILYQSPVFVASASRLETKMALSKKWRIP